MIAHPAWLSVRRGAAPLIVSLPHTGADIPPEIETRLLSPWLSRKDTDWWVGYMREPLGPGSPETWPVEWDEDYAGPITQSLERLLEECLRWPELW